MCVCFIVCDTSICHLMRACVYFRVVSIYCVSLYKPKLVSAIVFLLLTVTSLGDSTVPTLTKNVSGLGVAVSIRA